MIMPNQLHHTDKIESADRLFMERCLSLAVQGTGYTSPNPLVGAVLVHDGRIIGEGFHRLYGQAHAEVNCIESVTDQDRHLIPHSTLYVSLEPCCHFGKTPPCTDLIIREQIKKVVVGCRDPFPAVNGKGIEKLRAHRVEVVFPVLEELAKEVNRRFFTFHLRERPYIILKWAESANHKISGSSGQRIYISNTYSNRLVHKWRTEEAAIMIGTDTALTDDPLLTARLWPGKNPIRIVLDRNLRLPPHLKIFDNQAKTIIINTEKETSSGMTLYKKINPAFQIHDLLSSLHADGVLSILVEGGAKLLQRFIEERQWDEIRTITNHSLQIENGIESPRIQFAQLITSQSLGSDLVSYYQQITS